MVRFFQRKHKDGLSGIPIAVVSYITGEPNNQF